MDGKVRRGGLIRLAGRRKLTVLRFQWRLSNGKHGDRRCPNEMFGDASKEISINPSHAVVCVWAVVGPCVLLGRDDQYWHIYDAENTICNASKRLTSEV